VVSKLEPKGRWTGQRGEERLPKITWSFEHSAETAATPQQAWSFWTNVENWAVVDSSVEWVRLDGPFLTGTKGTTKPQHQEAIAWHIADVDEGRSAIIEVEIDGAVMRFIWRFEELAGKGTRLTQTAELAGDDAEKYKDAMTEFEFGIPLGMAKLADAIDRSVG
jgi:hypothetical protein